MHHKSVVICAYAEAVEMVLQMFLLMNIPGHEYIIRTKHAQYPCLLVGEAACNHTLHTVLLLQTAHKITSVIISTLVITLLRQC